MFPVLVCLELHGLLVFVGLQIDAEIFRLHAIEVFDNAVDFSEIFQIFMRITFKKKKKKPFSHFSSEIKANL